MFKNQGRFSYLFSFLVSNATDGQEAEPDHPQGCFNANVKFHNVKKHPSYDPDSRGPSVDASLHCILPLHLLAEGRRSASCATSASSAATGPAHGIFPAVLKKGSQRFLSAAQAINILRGKSFPRPLLLVPFRYETQRARPAQKRYHQRLVGQEPSPLAYLHP